MHNPIRSSFSSQYQLVITVLKSWGKSVDFMRLKWILGFPSWTSIQSQQEVKDAARQLAKKKKKKEQSLSMFWQLHHCVANNEVSSVIVIVLLYQAEVPDV